MNHATLAGHSFQHEVALAIANDIFGSVDANRGDPQNGWDTDQFPNDPIEMGLALYEILRGGGLTTGGFNFDAKLRRQSLDPVDLFHAHVGGMDTMAEALLVAETSARPWRAPAQRRSTLCGVGVESGPRDPRGQEDARRARGLRSRREPRSVAREWSAGAAGESRASRALTRARGRAARRSNAGTLCPREAPRAPGCVWIQGQVVVSSQRLVPSSCAPLETEPEAFPEMMLFVYPVAEKPLRPRFPLRLRTFCATTHPSASLTRAAHDTAVVPLSVTTLFAMTASVTP